jgi:hypothetical protein
MSWANSYAVVCEHQDDWMLKLKELMECICNLSQDKIDIIYDRCINSDKGSQISTSMKIDDDWSDSEENELKFEFFNVDWNVSFKLHMFANANNYFLEFTHNIHTESSL